MRAAFCPAPGTIELREVDAPRPESGEVVVRVRACGVCGSDLHWFHGAVAPPSVCPGHEIAGEIERCGSAVRGFAAGDRVAVEPMAVDRECHYCRTGRPQLCPRLRILGMRRPGGFAELVAVPSYALFRFDEPMDWALAALTEPMAVAVHAVRIGAVTLGSRVLIIGAGTLGLLCALAARTAGAGEVLIVARYPQQRAMAERLGAIAAPVDEHGHPTVTADVVMETVGGTADTLSMAVQAVRPAGSVVVLGVFAAPPTVPGLALIAKEVRLVGSLMYDRAGPRPDFDLALDLLRRHGEVLLAVVTHRFGLDDIQSAFLAASDKHRGAIKVAVLPAQ